MDWSFSSTPFRVQIMAILNANQDSFYTPSRVGGLDRELVSSQAQRFVEEGADFIDIGAESTRPGSHYIDEDEELKRILPVLRIAREAVNVPISIDTRKYAVAERCLDAGANIINDISGLRDSPGMDLLAARYDAGLVIMHMQGRPDTMQNNPHYDELVSEIRAFLDQKATQARANGVRRIAVDPGIGFGKNDRHNLELLGSAREFARGGNPVLIGTSRKGFLGRMLERNGNPLPPEERLFGGLATAAAAFYEGVSIVRVHEVSPYKQLLSVLGAIESVGEGAKL